MNSQLNLKDYDLTLNDFPVHDSIAEYVFTQNSFVATQIDALEIYDKLEKKNVELKLFLTDLESKNKDLEMLLGEVHHRVKNNLQTVSALLRLQSRRIEDPAAAAALEEAVSRGGFKIRSERLTAELKKFVYKKWQKLVK